MSKRTIAEQIRTVLLDCLDPVVAVLISRGLYTSDETQAILVAEGLARQSEHGRWMEWTPEGDVLREVLERAIEKAIEQAKAEPAPAPAPAPDAPTVDTAIACIREAARARGGVL